MSNKTIIEVEKNGNENGASVLRRFGRISRDAGVIRHVRKNRYAQRKASALKTKEGALRRIKKVAEIKKLRKLGKLK